MLKLSDVLVRYDTKTVLDIESLEIPLGKFTAIVGRNGSGKSTALSVIANQARPTSGLVTLNGRQAKAYGKREFAKLLAYLPQTLPAGHGMTVADLCLLGRFAWRGTMAQWVAEDHQAVANALQVSDLSDRADSLLAELSGGQFQRAWIAMMLAQDSQYLVLDEPTAALDLKYQLQVMEMLKKISISQNKGIVVVIHDINIAARFADRIVVLRDGKISFDDNSEKFLDAGNLHTQFGLDFSIVKHPKRDENIALIN